MKTIVCVSALAVATACADPDDYVNFVRQIQEDSGIEWDVSVAPSGSMLSPEGVGPHGSLFQLWSIHSLTASEYRLDEEFVSAYTADAAIAIITGDPYEHIARTRVDKAFTVEVSVSGLLEQTGVLGVPLSATQVLLRHEAAEFPEGQHSFDAEGEGASDSGGLLGEPLRPLREIAAAILNSNGLVRLDYPVTNLTGDDLTQVEGEEVWTVFAVDGGLLGLPLVAGDMLESATLQVWPIADATISGLDPAANYETVPPVSVSLRDLYPDSTTHVRVYAGAPTSQPTEPSKVQSSYVIIQDSIPQNRTINLDELDDYFPKTGSYTIEVVHETPFGTEVLTQFYPVNIDRTISIRGSVYTTE